VPFPAGDSLLASIIEFLPDATFVIDLEKRLVAWNRACEAMTGVPKDAVLGRGDYAYAEAFVGERRPILIDLLDLPSPQVEAYYKYVVRRGDTLCAETFRPNLRHGQGAHLWGEAAPLYDNAGRRCGTIEVIRDVTEQKQVEKALRESERKFRTVFETAGDAILLMSRDHFVDCNARSLTMFGCDRGQLIGSSPYAFSPPVQPDGRPSEGAALERIGRSLNEGPQLFEWMHCRADRTPFPAEVGLNSIELDGELMIQAVVRDITLRKQAEAEVRELHEALRQHAGELERRVEARTAQLAARNEELKEFAYTVSHDLKAPLRGISGYANELTAKHGGALSERGRFCLSQIMTASSHLDHLIEDLLRYSRLDAETPSPATVNLRNVVQALLRDRELIVREQHVEITVDLPFETVRVWERALAQVLGNLVDNAIKYSRGSDPPRVRIAASETADAWRVAVSDNGVGFDMKYHDRIFKLFHRLVRMEEFEGTGAGLAIVKKLVERQNGRIWAESAPGQGATFFVELPRLRDGT
jgi:PAS domain S-box-containing protein